MAKMSPTKIWEDVLNVFLSCITTSSSPRQWALISFKVSILSLQQGIKKRSTLFPVLFFSIVRERKNKSLMCQASPAPIVYCLLHCFHTKGGFLFKFCSFCSFVPLSSLSHFLPICALFALKTGRLSCQMSRSSICRRRCLSFKQSKPQRLET